MATVMRHKRGNRLGEQIGERGARERARENVGTKRGLSSLSGIALISTEMRDMMA